MIPPGALREQKLEESTLIFFSSDNGGPEHANGSNNGPLHGGKATTWEGGIRLDADILYHDVKANRIQHADGVEPPAVG